MHLTFPPAAAEALAALDRQGQLHASAFLATAARRLGNHPYRPIDGCTTGHNCPVPLSAPPRRTGSESPATALCALCALDIAVERYSRVMDEAVQREFWAVGTVVKQAYIDTLEANADLRHQQDAPEQITLMLSSRLHTGDLTPAKAADIAEEADRLVCLRAIERPGLGGRLINPLPRSEVMRSLEQRGWVAGGYVTPAGRHAVERHHAAIREHRKQVTARAGRTR